MAADVNNPAPESAGGSEEQDPREVLDGLYGLLGQTSHSLESLQDDSELRSRLEEAEAKIIPARLQAAQSGDHATYQMLSEQQADLQRAYQLLEDMASDDTPESPPDTDEESTDDAPPDSRQRPRDERRGGGEPSDSDGGPPLDRDDADRIGDAGRDDDLRDLDGGER